MPIFPNPSPVRLGVPRRPRPIVPREQRETLEEHEAAQSAIEFATLRRQADETMNAALRAASEAPDPASSQAIFDKATQAVSKFQSKNIRVQSAYQSHLEGSLAGWGEGFARQAKAAQEKRIHDKGLQEYDAALDAGDLVGAIKITEHLKTIEPENASIYEKMAADAPSASALRQVRNAVAEGDLQGARASIEEARKLPLSVEQKEDLARLEGAVGRGEREQVVQTQIEILTAADAAAALPPTERHAEIERLKALAAPLYRTPEEARAGINWLNAIDEGKPIKIDPQAEIEANDIIRTLTADSTPQENAEARDKILALSQRLGPRTFDFIKELGTRLDSEKTKAVEYAAKDAEARGLIAPDYAPVLRRDLEKWVNGQKGDVAPVDIIKRGAELAAMGPPPVKAIYTPAQVQGVFADLQIGGRIVPGDPLGGIAFWEDDDESKAWEKAVARALEGLQGDEPNLLRAMSLIKQKYPEAEIVPGQVSVPWTSLPEDVKRRDFEALSKARVTGGWIWKSYEPVGGWTQDQISKAHEEGMTPEKFGTWLREQGQVRMVPAAGAAVGAIALSPTPQTAESVQRLPHGAMVEQMMMTRKLPRIVGLVYVNSRGQKAEWTGKGWKPVP